MTWISVKKSLPKEDSLYLVYCLTSRKPFVTTGWYDPDYGWSLISENFIENLTHWATIPEPPSQEI